MTPSLETTPINALIPNPDKTPKTKTHFGFKSIPFFRLRI